MNRVMTKYCACYFFYDVLEGYLDNCIVVFNRAHVAFNQCSIICEWIMQ